MLLVFLANTSMISAGQKPFSTHALPGSTPSPTTVMPTANNRNYALVALHNPNVLVLCCGKTLVASQEASMAGQNRTRDYLCLPDGRRVFTAKLYVFWADMLILN